MELSFLCEIIITQGFHSVPLQNEINALAWIKSWFHFVDHVTEFIQQKKGHLYDGLSEIMNICHNPSD